MKLVYGRKPVSEAVKAGRTTQVFIAENTKFDQIKEIVLLAQKQGIEVTKLQREKFEQFVKKNLPFLPKETPHQGILAGVAEQTYYDLEGLIKKSLQKNKLIVVLDQVQDPSNLGAILRTVECAGVDGVVLSKHESADVTPLVVKTSAGAAEHVKICKVNNVVKALEELKNAGYWIIGSMLSDKPQQNNIDYNLPLVLVLGNEGKGIRKLVGENCDFLMTIPMYGNIQSLNVSASAAILIYHILERRGLGIK